MKEIWKPIPGWSMYEVSNLGRIKRLAGKTSNNRLWPSKILQTRGPKTKRAMASLHYGRKKLRWHVSRLVLLAFVGPPPSGKSYACHLDDDQHNDILSNLVWGSHQDNTEQAVANNKNPKGESHGMAKLTDEQVRMIRKKCSVPRNQRYGLIKQLTIELGVTKCLIHLIVKNKNWKHIQ